MVQFLSSARTGTPRSTNLKFAFRLNEFSPCKTALARQNHIKKYSAERRKSMYRTELCAVMTIEAHVTIIYRDTKDSICIWLGKQKYIDALAGISI